MIDNEQREKLLQEYDNNIKSYEDFTNILRNAIPPLLKQNGILYQNIQSRVKSKESLSEKLDREDMKKVNGLNRIVDIIGLRIITYTTNDITRTVELLQTWFKATKVIPPRAGYPSFNVRLRLGEIRAALPEYEKFKNFPFEIQVTSAVFHAWIEQTHDVLYKKKSELMGIHPNLFNYIENGYKNLKDDELNMAQLKLDALSQTVKDLRDGKEPFYPEEVLAFPDSNDNNYLGDRLSSLELYIKDYGDTFLKGIPFVETLSKVILKSQNNPAIPVKTDFGQFKGKTSSEITKQVLKIFDLIKFYDHKEPKEYYYNAIITELLEAYPKLSDENKTLTANFLGEIVAPAWKGETIYFFPSKIFIEKSRLKNILEKSTIYIDVIKSTYSKLLSLDVQKTTSEKMDTITFHSASLPIDNHINEIRDDALSDLEATYTNSCDERIRMQIAQTFHNAMRSSLRGGNTDKHRALIRNDTNRILNFYSENVDDNDFSVLHEIEHQIAFLNRNFRENNMHLEILIKKLTNNKEYQLYKLLFGWAYYKLSLSGLRYDRIKSRKSEIDNLIDEITDADVDIWVMRLKSFIKSYKLTYSLAGDDARELEYFLEELSSKKSDIAKKIHKKLKIILQEFNLPFIKGFWESDIEYASKLIETFISSNADIYWLCWGIKYLKGINPTYVQKLLERTIQKKEIHNLNLIVSSIFETEDLAINCDENLVEAFKFLNRKKNVGWVMRLHVFPDIYSVLDNLSIKTLKVVLNNLLYAPTVTYEIETVLGRILIGNPVLVLNYLKQRIERKKDFTKSIEHYSAVPYELHYLDFKNSESEEALMRDLFDTWTRTKDTVKRWEYSRLFYVAFTKDTALFTNVVKEIINTEPEGAPFALEVLKELEGWEIVDDVCKHIIMTQEVTSDLEKRICRVYEHTGTVTGEYGFANAFKERLESVKKWKDDPDTKIQEFAIKLSEYLEIRFAQEFEDAEKEQSLRKIKYRTKTGKNE